MVITINRPDKKNALTQMMYKQLSSALIELQENSELAVGLITGSQQCFTAGNDLHDFIQLKTPEDMADVKAFLHELGHIKKPFLAAVDGAAVGIGTTLLAHCDLCFASPSAYFQMPFVNLGLCAEAGSSALMPQIIGQRRANELFLLGERITAEKACQYGLINEVINSDVLKYTLEKAHQISEKPIDALLAIKKQLKENTYYDHDTVINEEYETFFKLLQSHSTQQTIKSFFDKK